MRTLSFGGLAAALLSVLQATLAFSPPLVAPQHSTQQRFCASPPPQSSIRSNILLDKFCRRREYWFLRAESSSSGDRATKAGDIKQFLTQRSVQTLIFVLGVGRDQITADWLEKWAGHDGLAKYHGLGGLHLNWDEYLTTLLRLPPEEVTVEFKRRGAGVGGWSKDNPYLQNHVYEYTEKIEPSRLAQRIINLRSDIAEEWIEDLALIPKENEEMWRSFFEKVRENGEDKVAHLQFPVFDKDFTDSNCGTSYRGGNYDLLKRFATLRAIQTFLMEKGGGKEGEISRDFLDRVFTVYGTDFEGDSHYGVDSKFIEALLDQAPKLVREQGSEDITMISPVSIAESVLGMRDEVARRWIDELQSVKDENTKLLTDYLMQSYST